MPEDANGFGSHLAIEVGTALQLDAPRAVARLKSQFVGLLDGSCVIVTRPAVPFETGDSVVTRYLYRGSVFGFRSVVTGVVNYPVKLLILAYPTTIEKQSIRSEPRLACLLPCQLERAAAAGETNSDEGADAGEIEPAGASGVITDISVSGCRLVIPSEPAPAPPLRLDETVELRFRGPVDGRDFAVNGTIRRMTTDREHLDLGIAFDAPVDEPCDQIRAMLEVVHPAQVGAG